MTSTPVSQRARDRAGIPAGARVIDADMHVELPSVEVLLPFLAPHWRETIELSGHAFFFRPAVMCYPPSYPTSRPPGAPPASGEPVEEARGRVRRDLLDDWGLERAIASVPYFADMLHNPYLADAMARAVNDWFLAEWLAQEPRLLGTMLVSAENPELAVREIERLGADPRIVGVLLPLRSSRPYGNLLYRPIFRAAAEHDLVVTIHYGGWPGAAPTALGWPSYYVEEWAARGALAQTQLMSVIAEGVFADVPGCRLLFAECGWAWLPAFLWRFDKDWKGLRRETPWVDRLPSSHLGEHVRFTLQPLDGPGELEPMRRVLEQVGAAESLLFSTDYPHSHFDDPAHAIPEALLDGAPSGMLFENAASFYRLEEGS